MRLTVKELFKYRIERSQFSVSESNSGSNRRDPVSYFFLVYLLLISTNVSLARKKLLTMNFKKCLLFSIFFSFQLTLQFLNHQEDNISYAESRKGKQKTFVHLCSLVLKSRNYKWNQRKCI